MDIHIHIEGQHDLIGQIYRQLRAAILAGRLTTGAKLPSTRELAQQLGVSRKTTLEAFERLASEGYLFTRQGDGTYVAEAAVRLQAQANNATPSVARVRPIWSDMPKPLTPTRPDAALPYEFQGGVTDKTLFPFDVWRQCMNHAMRVQARGRGTYGEPAGVQELRLAISRYLAYHRGVASHWQDILVTQGAQHALDLLARVLVEPGDVVAVEDPGYPPVWTCLRAQGAKLVPVPVDAEGMIVEQLPDNARMVYVTPSHQFPLGMPMSLPRRLALLAWAKQRGAVIVEDDYDGEFRFDGRPLESLKSLDRTGSVAYVGTFSKTIFPDLRIGYVMPPPTLIEPLCQARQACDWHGCTLTQTALARFMLDGDFAKHLRRAHKHYTARRAALLTHLQGDLAEWFEPIVPMAGIHLVSYLKPGLTEAAVIAAAREHAIGLYGIRAFHQQVVPRPGLLFGYAGIGLEAIHTALRLLATVMPTVAAG